MRILNKIHKNGCSNLPIYERKYVLGHKDNTRSLYLYILDDYSDFFTSEKKDEVFFYWEKKNLHAWVEVFNEKSKFSSKERYEIFKKHMKNSILAFIKLENKALELNPKLTISFYEKDRLISKEVYEKLLSYVSLSNEFENNIKY